MGKSEERTPLLAKKEDGGKSEEVSKPTFSDLFVCATRNDKCLLGFALAIGILGTSLYPLVMISSQFAFIGAAPYEALTREIEESGVLTPENETALSEAGDKYISLVVTSLLLVVGLTLLMAFIKFWNLYIFGKVAVRLTRRLRYQYVSHVLSMDLGASQQKTTGELIAMLDENIIKICDALENNLPLGVDGAIQLLATLSTVFSIRWDIGLIMLFFIVPAAILFYIGTKSYIKMVGIEQGCFAKAAQIANECFVCIKTVICFNGQQRTIDKYNNAVDDAMHVSHKRRSRITLIDASKILITDTLCIIAVVYGATFLGDTEPFLFVTILMMSMQLSGVIAMLNMHINAIFVAVGSANQVNRILAIIPEIEVPDKGVKPQDIGPEISFQNVSFHYPSRPDVEVIKDFNLKISPGQRIAIVGESGCGKSTIAALLMRFFDPTSGVITIDGKPSTSLNVDWLRRQFGFVTQEPVLFDMSIYDNVQCSKPDASYEEIVDALNQANAMHFITEMAQGLDTRAGERGCQLSGGQKQRVAIARALLRKPAVLIFDEATSSLDSESEALVQAAIDRVSQSHTTVTIAHRLSTILSADQVLVMDQGCISESGSPDELINKRQIFYRLLQQQNIIASKNDVFSQSDSGTPETTARAKKQKRRRRVSSATTDPEQAVAEIAEQNPDWVQEQEESQPEELKQKRLQKVSTTRSVKNLMTLHPKWKRTMFMSVIAALIRGGRSVAFLVMLAMTFDALSYETDIMVGKIYRIAAIYATVIVVCFLSEFILIKGVGHYADEVSLRMRDRLLTHMLSQSLSYFEVDSHESGTLSSALATHPANIRETLASKLPEFLTAAFMCFEASFVAIFMNAYLIMVAGSLSLITTLIRVVESRFLLKEHKKLQPLQAEAATLVSEAFTNLETVKAYSMECSFTERYQQYYGIVEKQKMRGVVFNALLIASSCSFHLIAISLTWLIGAHMMVAHQNAPLLDIYLCAGVAGLVFSRLLMVLTQIRMITRALASCSAVTSILDERTEVDNMTKAGLMTDIAGDIAFRKVTFDYPTRMGEVLFRQLSLHIHQNKMVAVVGPSGSGKSTILQLILRLYDCDDGQIELDGTNVTALNPAHLRNSVVPVSQEPILFSGSIWDNITYGIDQQLISSDQVEAAAKAANIHDFIISLPEGYNTDVGQLGGQLSGGQKQRVAIARALIRNPRVLLLDEATAALDSASEAAVQIALDKAQHGCTCVTVAHRLSTVQNCDLIIVVAEGKIVEKGTHVYLMEKRGLYYNMCLRQQTIDD